MTNGDYVTDEDLRKFEEKMDLIIATAIQPLETKIDTLPHKVENLLLKEREYQNKKREETNKFIVGTIVIGGLGLLSGILMPIIMHFATN